MDSFTEEENARINASLRVMTLLGSVSGERLRGSSVGERVLDTKSLKENVFAF